MPHIKEPDKRENVWHKRTPVRARANPNHISTQHMTYASHTAQSVPLHNRCQFPSADTDHRCPSTDQQRHKDLCPNNADQDATFRSSGMVGLSKGLVNTGKVTNRGAVDHRNKGVPSTWRPFSQETIAATLPTQYDNCILFKPRIAITELSNCLNAIYQTDDTCTLVATHLRRPRMSPATRAQALSNHWTQQLPARCHQSA